VFGGRHGLGGHQRAHCAALRLHSDMAPSLVKMLRLRTDLKELERAQGGAIWGHVWLQTSNCSFPEERWWDVIVPVVTWWSTALAKVTGSKIPKDSHHFLDGPFRVDLSLSPENQNLVSVCLVKKRVNDEMLIDSTEEDVVTLLRNTIAVGKELVAACEKRGWADRDVANLFSAVQKVEDVLGSRPDSKAFEGE